MKKSTRHYAPRKYKRKDNTNALYRKIFVTLAISIGILVAMYFWVITFFSNINNVWSFFSTDSGGNTFIKDDRIAPAAPRLIDIPEATKEKTIEIKGFGESGSKAELYFNGEKKDELVVDTSGSFTLEDIGLELGENLFYVVLTDQAGNESQPSKTYTVVYDNKAPKLFLTEPEGNEMRGDNPHTISGVSEEGAYVTVNGRFARVDPDGSFEIKLFLDEGDNQLIIESKDKAENVSKIEKTLNYVKED